jgi:hypothetical protein
MEQIITVIVTGVCGVLTAGPVRVVRACFDLGDFGCLLVLDISLESLVLPLPLSPLRTIQNPSSAPCHV